MSKPKRFFVTPLPPPGYISPGVPVLWPTLSIHTMTRQKVMLKTFYINQVNKIGLPFFCSSFSTAFSGAVLTSGCAATSVLLPEDFLLVVSEAGVKAPVLFLNRSLIFLASFSVESLERPMSDTERVTSDFVVGWPERKKKSGLKKRPLHEVKNSGLSEKPERYGKLD
jgi:hypothetical protein